MSVDNMNSTAAAHFDGHRYRLPAPQHNDVNAPGNAVNSGGNGDNTHHQADSLPSPQDGVSAHIEHQDMECQPQKEVQCDNLSGMRNGVPLDDQKDQSENSTLNALRQENFTLRKQLAYASGSHEETAILRQKISNLQQLCKRAQAALDMHRDFREKVREAAVPIAIIQLAFRDELAEQRLKGLDTARAAFEENFTNLLAAAFEQKEWAKIEEEARRLVEELEADCCPSTQLAKFTMPVQRNMPISTPVKQESAEQFIDVKRPVSQPSVGTVQTPGSEPQSIHQSDVVTGQKVADNAESDTDADSSSSEDDDADENEDSMDVDNDSENDSECAITKATSPSNTTRMITDATVQPASTSAGKKFDHGFQHLKDMPSLDPDNHEWITLPLGTMSGSTSSHVGYELSPGILVGQMPSTTGPQKLFAHIIDTKRGPAIKYRTEEGNFLAIGNFWNKIKFVEPFSKLTRGPAANTGKTSTQLLRGIILFLFERRLGRELGLESRANHEKALFTAFNKIRSSG